MVHPKMEILSFTHPQSFFLLLNTKQYILGMLKTKQFVVLLTFKIISGKWNTDRHLGLFSNLNDLYMNALALIFGTSLL